MQTRLVDSFRNTADGREAEAILRSCVHCGFCLATCPTYQVTGDELDSPRGRIYLIQQMLEGRSVGMPTQRHLDRCLSCRACETVCPSGVHYGRLLEIGRSELDVRVPRGVGQRFRRWLLRTVVAEPRRFAPLLTLGRLVRPLLPRRLANRVPAPVRVPARSPSLPSPGRRMLTLAGCAQSVATPATNAAAARVLARLGIELVEAPDAGCCGALDDHLGAHQAALARARRNVDAWWPYLADGAEAVAMTASGCGVTVRDYGRLLRHDATYAEKAARVSEVTRDLSEVIAVAIDGLPTGVGHGRRVAVHLPCTLTHGQRVVGSIEAILLQAGFDLVPVADSHLCCGSAGAYSLLQPEMAGELRRRKLTALTAAAPECVVTANVGCQLHLQAGTRTPVRHWVELLDTALSDGA